MLRTGFKMSMYQINTKAGIGASEIQKKLTARKYALNFRRKSEVRTEEFVSEESSMVRVDWLVCCALI
jgi:hypothetical protein